MELLSKLVFLITLSCIFLTGCVLDYDDNRLAEFEVISSGYQSALSRLNITTDFSIIREFHRVKTEIKTELRHEL